MKLAAERLPIDFDDNESPLGVMNQRPTVSWQTDETLQAYIEPVVDENRPKAQRGGGGSSSSSDPAPFTTTSSAGVGGGSARAMMRNRVYG